METDLSKLHKGKDGFYYDDYIAPDAPVTFIGKFVSSCWWHKGDRFALICNFETENGQRIALFAFQKYTGFYGPRCGNINFKEVKHNTFWLCNVQKAKTGRCYWASAKEIDNTI